MGTHTPKIAALIGENDAVIYIDEPPSLNVLEVKFMLPESDEFLGSVIERYNGWDKQQAKIDELVAALEDACLSTPDSIGTEWHNRARELVAKAKGE